MPDLVKVEDLEVFRLFRVALLKFAQAAQQSLANADGQITRTHAWLENEQTTFWQGQLRKRTEAVARAREALRQKKLFKDSAGRTPNAAQEEKTLAQCLAAVEEAQHKIEAVRKWLPKLEKEAEMYRGGVSRLGGTVTVEVPQAIALLDRLAATLEQYVQIEAPATSVPESATPSAFDESMSRGGDSVTEPLPTATHDTPSAEAGDSPAPPSPQIPDETHPRKES